MGTLVEYEVVTPVTRDNQEFGVGAPIMLSPTDADELIKVGAIKLPGTRADGGDAQGSFGAVVDASGQPASLEALRKAEADVVFLKAALESSNAALTQAHDSLAAMSEAKALAEAKLAELLAQQDAASKGDGNATAPATAAASSTASASDSGAVGADDAASDASAQDAGAVATDAAPAEAATKSSKATKAST